MKARCRALNPLESRRLDNMTAADRFDHLVALEDDDICGLQVRRLDKEKILELVICKKRYYYYYYYIIIMISVDV